MGKTVLIVALSLLFAGCSTKPIQRQFADSPRFDQILDKEYLTPIADCRPVHLTRDAGLVLGGINLVVFIDDKPTVALERAETLEVCLPPKLYKITVIPALHRSVLERTPGSVNNYVLMNDPKIRGETEIDTRPDMRFNVRIKSTHLGLSQKTEIEYTGERLIR